MTATQKSLLHPYEEYYCLFEHHFTYSNVINTFHFRPNQSPLSNNDEKALTSKNGSISENNNASTDTTSETEQIQRPRDGNEGTKGRNPNEDDSTENEDKREEQNDVKVIDLECTNTQD